MRTAITRLLLPALLAWQACGSLASAQIAEDVLDFSTIGTANDPLADNTAALITALEERSANTDTRMVIYFPAGDWYFDDELPVGTHGDLTIFDNVTFIGARTGQSAQHQEEGNANAERSRTRFVIDMDGEDDIWWNQIRTYRYGPLAFSDITFQVVDVGSVFSFGDTTDLDAGEQTARALSFERCYFTHLRHFVKTDVGGGHAWMYDADAGAGVNYVLNTTNQSFSLRLHKCYDVTVRDCAFRGARYGIINSHGDRPVFDNVRGFLIGKLLDEYSVPTNAAVGSQIDDMFIETPVLAGAVITGQAGKVRAEFGYNSSGAFSTVPVGPYALPSSVEWEIDDGSSTVDFTFPGGWGYNCTDYFEPRTVIRVNPDEANEPDRYLYVTSVSATSVTFGRSEDTSYVAREISGDGAGVTRFFGTGLIVDGDRAAVMEPSLGLNQDNNDLPIAFIVPDRRPIRFGANTETSNPDPDDPTNLPVVVAACAGNAFHLHAGVDWLGSNDPADHPLVNLGGIGPKYDAGVREPFLDPLTKKQLFVPGRGIGTANDCARDLTFHRVTDSELGQDVWCYRLDNSSVGWELRNIRKSGKPVTYKIRAYVPSGTPTLGVWGGASPLNTHTLSTGWQTITGSSHGPSNAVLTDAQVTGSVVQVGGNGIYVAWVEIDQN
ncbi:glycosyl hydrolase family 28-related protein [Lacipirellula parvula]|uniref:Rhamnogalacturonase A/B/Epimerase-like pectate lyase domain-containing protein n=1 Tax=Lacipirellula parvula TaxID=2650471 RepID=A0A5K7XID1_9BACT|nr:glycosyl hydrolase family 28-related protein [Lacipirellula parvula]BBO36208.1 hypothetical protein PLANPX_5820 [Lacipirellula parvula]